MDIQIIKVRYDLHVLEVTRHTNRKFLVTMCWDCLAKSKTNKEFIAYANFPTISSVRICSKCGAMTPSAIVNAFSLSLHNLIYMVQYETLLYCDDFPKPIKFVADPTTILSMKASILNGKKHR